MKGDRRVQGGAMGIGKRWGEGELTKLILSEYVIIKPNLQKTTVCPARCSVLEL